jgi:uncharacterized protein (TIGR03663 family)
MLQIMSKPLFLLIFFIIVALTVSFRVTDLSLRPMHSDEAVNAMKLGQLLEHSDYKYNPDEFHGPALYYLSLPFTWLSSEYRFSELKESTLRVVPLFFSIILIIIILLLPVNLPRPILLITAILTAESPIINFYSRYYIHEMLMVLFFYGLLFLVIRYLVDPKKYLFAAAGLSMGFLIAAKETWVIPVAASMIAALIYMITTKKGFMNSVKWIMAIPMIHWIIFITSVVIIYLILFSSFFQNWHGITDGLKTYYLYFTRSHSGLHEHPWYQYFDWLWFFGIRNGTYFTEIFIAIFAVIGGIATFRIRTNSGITSEFYKFVVWLTLICTLTFVIIPYKTPWNAMIFWIGFILLASFGMFHLFLSCKNIIHKTIFSIIIAIGIIHLAWQSYEENFKYDTSTLNPYIYAHPLDDVFKIEQKMEQLASVNSAGFNTQIHVSATGNDYWPLPWYLRKFRQVGWWDRIDFNSGCAPVIIISPDLEADLVEKLYEKRPPGQRNLYLPLFDGNIYLRPGKELKIFIDKSSWDLLQNTGSDQFE